MEPDEPREVPAHHFTSHESRVSAHQLCCVCNVFVSDINSKIIEANQL